MRSKRVKQEKKPKLGLVSASVHIDQIVSEKVIEPRFEFINKTLGLKQKHRLPAYSKLLLRGQKAV